MVAISSALTTIFAFTASSRPSSRTTTCKTTLLKSTTPETISSNISGPTTQEYQDLLTWLDSSFSDSFIHESLSIQPSVNGGHGAFVTTSIPKGTLLASIPRDACITSSDVIEDEDVGPVLKALIEKAGPGGFTVALAGFLAKEYLCQLEGKEGKFQPYFKLLPWDRGFNGQEHVLFWPEELVETLLPDSLCWKECQALRSEVKTAKRVLNTIIGPTVLRARGDLIKEEDEKPLIPFLSWTKPPPPKITEPVPGLGKAVSAAFVILLTRAFDDSDYDEQIQGEDAERLIPLLDMLNHNAIPSITYQTNDEGAVEVRSSRDIEEGEELYNRYREEEEMNMPYHRFFSRFGFVPGVTEDLENLFRDESSIFFARKREV